MALVKNEIVFGKDCAKVLQPGTGRWQDKHDDGISKRFNPFPGNKF